MEISAAPPHKSRRFFSIFHVALASMPDAGISYSCRAPPPHTTSVYPRELSPSENYALNLLQKIQQRRQPQHARRRIQRRLVRHLRLRKIACHGRQVRSHQAVLLLAQVQLSSPKGIRERSRRSLLLPSPVPVRDAPQPPPSHACCSSDFSLLHPHNPVRKHTPASFLRASDVPA
jgi:hypothetical protein